MHTYVHVNIEPVGCITARITNINRDNTYNLFGYTAHDRHALHQVKKTTIAHAEIQHILSEYDIQHEKNRAITQFQELRVGDYVTIDNMNQDDWQALQGQLVTLTTDNKQRNVQGEAHVQGIDVPCTPLNDYL